jgi:Skp family chaperone for outer membrane proteins
MNSIKAISLTLLASVLTATAAPRFAVIRVKDIYTDLPSTAALQQQVKKEREDIMKDQRAEDLRKILGLLQELQAQLSAKSKQLDEATTRKLAQTYEIKRQEAQTLQQEFESFKAEQDKAINRKMVAGMRASLDRIVKASIQIAKERGFDTVFDSSGDTNTGVPFVLYNKNAPDLTDDIMTMLKASEAAVKSTQPAVPPAATP